jgi:hypothetical protein
MGNYYARIFDLTTNKKVFGMPLTVPDMTIAVQKWGNPVGDAWGTQIELWWTTGLCSVNVYPMLSYEELVRATNKYREVAPVPVTFAIFDLRDMTLLAMEHDVVPETRIHDTIWMHDRGKEIALRTLDVKMFPDLSVGVALGHQPRESLVRHGPELGKAPRDVSEWIFYVRPEGRGLVPCRMYQSPKN